MTTISLHVTSSKTLHYHLEANVEIREFNFVSQLENHDKFPGTAENDLRVVCAIKKKLPQSFFATSSHKEQSDKKKHWSIVL